MAYPTPLELNPKQLHEKCILLVNQKDGIFPR